MHTQLAARTPLQVFVRLARMRISPNTEREYRKVFEAEGLLVSDPNDLPEVAVLHAALMASAAMDRLLHHCQILELDGNSYHNPPRRPRATPAPPADDDA